MHACLPRHVAEDDFRKCVGEVLSRERVDGRRDRMVGGLRDLRGGSYQNHAAGLRAVMGVPKSWRARERTIEGR